MKSEHKVLVIGAGGQIGQLLIRQLSETSCAVRAMVRDAQQAQFPPNIEIVESDLEGDVSDAMSGCQTVIFTAGSGAKTGFDKTLLVDLWGAKRAIDTAKAQGVSHFIMVSSRGADDPEKGPVRIKPYLVAKHFADAYLIESGLSYTILRPGRLIGESGEGLITTERPSDPEAQIISREDTANAILHCIENTAVVNKIYELFKGIEPIENALS